MNAQGSETTAFDGMGSALDPRSRLVYLVEADADLAEEIISQVAYFGYAIKGFAGLDGLAAAMAEAPPAVLVVDIGGGPECRARIAGVAALQATATDHLPVVFIADEGDIGTRLACVRAGGDAYFTKPLDINALVDELDWLISGEESRRYKVLLVETDAREARRLQLAMTHGELEVVTVNRPLQIMAALEETLPDLIVMEVDLPGYSGLELARAIRQQEAYLGIPIIFIAGSSDTDCQYAGLRVGEDFLVRPFDERRLAAVAMSRAQRARGLNSLMTQDGLTGLLTHARFKEQLDLEVARAGRSGQRLAFAMIDIDHFKAVNDRYGHLLGDRVIKTLARLFKDRLRRTDVVGRYGGEEFAAAFPDTDRDAAWRVLDGIREGFAHIHHRSGARRFTVTFSAGLSTYPECPDAEALLRTADIALYEAKRAGRNRLVAAAA
ncbi:MAG: diguanylate cyclase [Gammaproteobacteria bacterium]